MASYISWFVLALVLLALEIMTGTFYLLVIAMAMAVGGAAALLHLPLTAQLVLPALTTVVSFALWWLWTTPHQADAKMESLDTGHAVKILAWREDGTARVFYRGTEWDAELDSAHPKHDGTFYIKDIRGSVLILSSPKKRNP